MRKEARRNTKRRDPNENNWRRLWVRQRAKLRKIKNRHSQKSKNIRENDDEEAPFRNKKPQKLSAARNFSERRHEDQKKRDKVLLRENPVPHHTSSRKRTNRENIYAHKKRGDQRSKRIKNREETKSWATTPSV